MLFNLVDYILKRNGGILVFSISVKKHIIYSKFWSFYINIRNNLILDCWHMFNTDFKHTINLKSNCAIISVSQC
jgi:hypothetical protein